jgi:protein TonB
MVGSAGMLPSTERAGEGPATRETGSRAGHQDFGASMSEGASGKQSKRRPRGWRLAVGGSVAAHGCLLAALFCFGRWRSGALEELADATDPSWSAVDLIPSPSPVESAGAEISDPPLVPADVPRARPWDAREGERDNPVARTTAPANADGRDRRAPAPDRGLAGGAPLAAAYRLDSSTLRSRLTDGATEAQPARLRVASHRASPQAIRQEPLVGSGDSVRTATPTHVAAPAPSPTRAAEALGGAPAGGAPIESAQAHPETPPAPGRVDSRTVPDHAVGPLDAEVGPRRFDIQRPGRAADDQTQRTASDERHPGLTDFSRASAPRAVAAADGNGPASTPGAVARPSAGLAPAELGAPAPQAIGPQVEERTLDRRYQRYIQEVSQRVRQIREFPRSLALRLEQGETIVQFVVGIDGRLGAGPRVMKSSGFEEFDAAAVRAVRRAAPFPPMPDPGSARPLPVSLRVTFDNPVVR